jgi:hydroxymethylpyrimidine/phosphomethylpyrimidine kinase
MTARAPVALTIAGSDSGGGAGIQADLKTFSALGVYGASAITAITAQNTIEVRDVLALEPAFVVAQIDAVIDDIGADAVKTGMLANAEIIEAVADAVRRHELRPLIVDPVMVAKSGDSLLRDDAVQALREQLVPLATVLTPNLPEAEVLLDRKLTSWEDVRKGARDLVAMGARAVVMKGGHREGPAIDLLHDGEEFHEFTAQRVDTKNTHGTGCTFASAVAAGLAKGSDVRGAVAFAKAYVTKALQSSYDVGQGHGPVHHFYRFWHPTEREGGSPTWDKN